MFRLFIFIIITIIIITIIIIFRPVFYKCLGHLSLLAGINSIVCCHCLFVIYLFILYTFTYLLLVLLLLHLLKPDVGVSIVRCVSSRLFCRRYKPRVAIVYCSLVVWYKLYV